VGGMSLLDKLNREQERGSRPLVFVVFPFAFLYSFFNSYYKDFTNSPVAEAAHAVGAATEVLSICMLLAAVLGLAVCFTSAWQNLMNRWIGAKIALYVCAFVMPLCVPLAPTALMAYITIIIGAYCLGAIIGRALFTVILASLALHPALLIALAYIMIQAYLHAYDLIPALNTLPFYFIVGAPTLLAGLVFSFLLDGHDLERRWILPDSKISLASLWPILAVIALAQSCFAFYETIMLPQATEEFIDAAFEIIPNAVTILIFLLFGKRFTFQSVLIVLAALLCVGTIVYIEGSARVLVDMITQPAYLFFDLFFLWMMQIAYRAYSQNLIQYKIFVAANLAISVIMRTVMGFAAPYVPAVPEYALLLLLPIFLMSLLIPQVMKAKKRMESQRAYAEASDEQNVLLPTQREDVLEARDQLLLALSGDAALTDEELTVVAYQIGGLDADVTAHFMDVSVARVETLLDEIIAKFGCKNTLEWAGLITVAQANTKRRQQVWLAFDEYGLTTREKEVCAMLLTTGLSQKHISKELGLSNNTVHSYIKNLYLKFDVQSRAELVSKFAALDNSTTQ